MKIIIAHFNKYVNKHPYLIATLLLLVMFFLSFFSMLNDSITSDESIHIISGFTYLDKLDNRLNLEHPPLIKIVSAIPLIFLDLNYEFDDILNFVYKEGSNPKLILLLTRLPILFFTLLLGIFLFKWAKLSFGTKPALIALFIFTFSPNIIAHSKLVTTDMGAITSFFIFLYYFNRFINKPSFSNLTIAGLLFGIAQLTKFSNIILYFLIILSVAVLVLLKSNKNKNLFHFLKKIRNTYIRNILFYIITILIIFAIGNILIWIVYFIFSINMPPETAEEILSLQNFENSNIYFLKPVLIYSFQNSLLKPYALYLLGLCMTFLRVSDGAVVYFFGKLTYGSFWYFYPLSFIVKTPIATLTLFLSSIIICISSNFKKIITNTSNIIDKTNKSIINNYSEFMFWLIIILTFAIGISANLNIGLRHILIVYPFIFIIISKYIYNFFIKKPFLIKFIITLLFTWIVLENIFIFPHYIAYFNQLVGGNKNAYKYSVDSNLDWGQDLKRLAIWVKNNNIDEIKVDYGSGKSFHPEYYLGDRYIEWHLSDGETKGWIAISASELQTNKFWSPNQSDWLTKNHKPYYVLGGSILIYHIQ